ncbi:glycosyltransferase [Halorussus sp. JP-T4]|nr:glycosyltransferase [Halorussus sp. JP-T4]
MVCIEAGESAENLDYRTVPSFGVRPIGLLLMFLVGLVECRRDRYDAVVSFSLIPHGTFALAIGRAWNLPVHLGVIGQDLDVHARASYGPVIQLLLKRFDAVSVPGTTHRRQLLNLGVADDRIAILRNPVDVDRYRPAPDRDEAFDFVWVGRFQTEKRPRLFLQALAELHRRGAEFRGVMIGDGPLRSAVTAERARLGLEDAVELTGWVEDPLDYYHRSRIFVLTSSRDALPLTLVEAMATGTACIVPDVGNVTDVAEHGHNALVLDRMSRSSLATALERLLGDERLCSRFAANAPEVRRRYSYEAASADWAEILGVLRPTEDHEKLAAEPASTSPSADRSRRGDG